MRGVRAAAGIEGIGPLVAAAMKMKRDTKLRTSRRSAPGLLAESTDASRLKRLETIVCGLLKSTSRT